MKAPSNKIHDYVDDLLAKPNPHVALELFQDETGMKLLHKGKLLVECALTKEGIVSAGYMAKALGSEIPSLGQKITVRVSTGVLFRAVSISTLDFKKEESFVILERLLAESQMQLGVKSAES